MEFHVKTANVVKIFTVNSCKEKPFTETDTAMGGLLHSAEFQQNILSYGENVSWNSAYFMPGCPWCVSEHILDSSDLWYPS